jgi:hypothetical protein
MENYAVDSPSPLDYDFNIMLKWDEEVKYKLEYKNTYVQDQSIKRNPPTKSACTCFWLSHITTEQNYLDWHQKTVLWEMLREEALKRWAKDWKGWTLQWWLKLVKDKWLISWYTKVWSLEDIKKALNKKQLIYTGSNKISRSWTKKNNNIAVLNGTAWHCFTIIWYDDEKKRFIAKNSYWSVKYDWWYFYIPYKYRNDLFTKYAITDMSNEDIIKAEKIKADKESIQKVIDLWLINWKRMDENLTREEMSIIIGRLLKIIENK